MSTEHELLIKKNNFFWPLGGKRYKTGTLHFLLTHLAFSASGGYEYRSDSLLALCLVPTLSSLKCLTILTSCCVCLGLNADWVMYSIQ